MELSGPSTTPARPTKRRKLNEEPGTERSRTSYANNHAKGSSKNQYGDTYNTYHGPIHHHSRVVTPRPVCEGTKDRAFNLADAIDSLGFDEMDDRYDDIDPVYSGTCQWFFDGTEYKAWHDSNSLHEHHGFLWVIGKPGAGKSTLMKDAFIRGKNTFGGDTSHATVSFFFDARAGDSGQLLQKSTQGMFRSLLCQLLKKHPHVAAGLEDRRFKRAQEQELPLNLLQGLFRDAVLSLGSSQLTCYVDALDECEETEARTMVAFFESLGASTVERGVRFYVLFSSRHYPHIAIDPCQQLVLEDQEGHARDIERYVKSKLRIGNSKRAHKFRTALQEKASGVFLWVVLVIPSMNEDDARGDLNNLDRRLKETPDNLHELFANILKRGSHDESALLLTLQWLMFARRPLTREELYSAVWHDSRDDNIQAWNPDDVTVEDMSRFLLNSSKGLTELTKRKRPRVRFIHESVRDYLRATGLKSLDRSLEDNLAARCHDRLKQCCYHHLRKSQAALLPSVEDGEKEHMSQDKSAFKKLGETAKLAHPFLSYALEGIIYHAESAHSTDVPQTTFVSQFPHRLWRRLYNLTSPYDTRRLSLITSPIYTFVLMGATSLVEIEIEGHDLSDMKPQNEYHLSLLGAAVDNGDHHMAGLLLNHGADPNSISNLKMRRCLTLAIQRNDRLMVQRLIDAGATVDGNDLYEASRDSHVDVLSVLLTHSTYATGWHEDCEKMMRGDLTYAPAIKEIFLKKLDALRFDPTSLGNPKDIEPGYRCALESACRHGNFELVKILLAQLFDDDSSNGESTRRLYKQECSDTGCEQEDRLVAVLDSSVVAAAEGGHLEIVRVLLSRGVDVNATDSDGNTAFRATAIGGDAILVEFLLSNGARVDKYNSLGSSPLHTAASRGHGSVVELLLHHGTLVGFRDRNGSTLLHSAAFRGDERTMQLLLDHRIDPNIKNRRENESVLHHASRDGHEQAVPVSLGHRAVEVNAFDSVGESALVWAARCGHKNIVQMLLIAGDPVPLSQLSLSVEKAEYYSHDAIVQILIEHGAIPP